MLNRIKYFFAENKALVSAIAILIVLSIAAIFLIFLFYPNNINSEKAGDSTYYTDEVSGEELRNIDQEPEEDGINFIGFNKYIEYGYSYEEYDIIMDTIQNFISENFPSTTQVSFKKDSFYYDSKNPHISYSEFVVTDNSETFTVRIDLTNNTTYSSNTVYYNIEPSIKVDIINSEGGIVYSSDEE